MQSAAKVQEQEAPVTTTFPAAGVFMPEQGGFFVGVVRVDGQRYGVVIAPKATGETKGAWGARGEVIDARRFGDGQTNTKAMAEAGSPIATWATGLDINGHQDWYVPSRDELELIYRNLKPTAETNDCWFRDGENPSSVPVGFLYEPESPAQATAEAFREGGDEAMDDTWYWSSSQSSAYYAIYQYFGDGNQDDILKFTEGRVRACRRFSID